MKTIYFSRHVSLKGLTRYFIDGKRVSREVFEHEEFGRTKDCLFTTKTKTGFKHSFCTRG